MKSVFAIAFFLSIASILFYSCEKKSETNFYVARVDDNYLLTEEIKDRFDSSSIKSKSKIQEFINSWVNTNLLYKEAKNRNITDSSRYKELVEEAKKEIAINLLLENEIYGKSIELSDQETSEYYNYHKNEFLLGNDVINISYIIVTNKDVSNQFKNSVSNKSWNTLVQQLKSNSNQKYFVSNEDSVILKQNEVSSIDVWRNAINMKPGDISNPIKVSDGYLVLKLNSSQKAGQIGNIDYAISEIRERLILEKKRKYYSEFLYNLQKRYQPEVRTNFLIK